MTSKTDAYRVALHAAQASYAEAAAAVRLAEAEVEGRKAEMSQLRRTITALAAQCSEEPELDPMGITEACSGVMEKTIFTLSTQEVVSRLVSVGFDITLQKNVAASVHAILTRLANKGKITKISNEEGKSTGWRGPSYNREEDKDGPLTLDPSIPF